MSIFEVQQIIATLGIYVLLPFLIPVVAYFVVRADENRLGRSLNSGRDAIIYYMANIFLYMVYTGVTMMFAQFLLMGDGEWMIFRLGFAMTGVSVVFLGIVAVLRARLEAEPAISALKSLATSDSPYLKLYSGLNLIGAMLAMSTMLIFGIFTIFEVLFQESVKFESISEPFRVGLVVFGTTSGMVLLNYMIFSLCSRREVPSGGEADDSEQQQAGDDFRQL